MDFLAGIGAAFAIRSYLQTLKDYFSPVIRKTRKRLKGEFFEYDMADNGDLRFWRDLLKDEFSNPFDKKIEPGSKFLHVGDIVELENSNISRWVPVFPGKKYSVEGKRVLDYFHNEFPKNHDFGLEEELVVRNDSTVLSGSANIRLLPINNEYLLCASGLLCETGIPVLFSEKMYNEKLQDLISKNGCASARIECTISELPGNWKDRIIKKNLELSNIYGLPRIVLKVNTIKKVGTPANSIAEAWTQFVDVKYRHTSMMSSIFSPTDPDDIQKAVNMIANYKKFLESGLIGGEWDIDIEFDETRNWFKSGHYRTYDINGVDLFGLYYPNPWGRSLLDPKQKMRDPKKDHSN